MIASAGAFVLTVSAVAGLAAWVADAGLRRMGRPSRWVWLASLAAAPGLLALDLMGVSGPGGGGGPLGPVPVVEIPGIVLGPGASVGTWFGLAPADLALGGLWLLASLALLATLVRAHRALARERRRWRTARVAGREVRVSGGRGPAVAGLAAPGIVLPEWALHLPEAELELVLVHEEEHLRAGDPVLLAGALALLVLTAWNPVAWWQLRRLRTAVEVDCDRRVLAVHPDRLGYGASLLSVAARASGPSLAVAAFSERSTSLEHRIRAMTRIDSPGSRALGALLVVVAVLLGAQACGVDTPLEPEAEAPALAPDGVAAAPVAEVAPPSPPIVGEPRQEPPPPPAAEPGGPEPSFTPFTVAPSLQNRLEVVEGMEAEYPPLLREAGIGGTARVFFHIDAGGRVEHVRLDQSSGHEALDRAALAVADVYRFSPALHGQDPVPVWVSFPITFQAGGGG